jgi:signal transduction histidine kinase
MERGMLDLASVSIDVVELVDDVIQTVMPVAFKAQVVIERRVAEGLGTISGDPARLRQVLLNLVDNALKFTPPGGRVTITAEHGWIEREASSDALVLLAARQPSVVITVSDTGIGIPDDEKAKVFDAFYQVDSGTTRLKGGAGLGLSIVRRLVEAHQGTVRVLNVQPAGTAFLVSLPKQRASFR